jgi:hypothetical protein
MKGAATRLHMSHLRRGSWSAGRTCVLLTPYAFLVAMGGANVKRHDVKLGVNL